LGPDDDDCAGRRLGHHRASGPPGEHEIADLRPRCAIKARPKIELDDLQRAWSELEWSDARNAGPERRRRDYRQRLVHAVVENEPCRLALLRAAAEDLAGIVAPVERVGSIASDDGEEGRQPAARRKPESVERDIALGLVPAADLN